MTKKYKSIKLWLESGGMFEVDKDNVLKLDLSDIKNEVYSHKDVVFNDRIAGNILLKISKPESFKMFNSAVGRSLVDVLSDGKNISAIDSVEIVYSDETYDLFYVGWYGNPKDKNQTFTKFDDYVEIFIGGR